MGKVVFTKRAYTSLCIELMAHLDLETGGVFLGYVEKDMWYIIETIFSGPLAIHKSAEYSYDLDYVNYQANQIAKIYDKELCIIGLWHSHITSAPFSLADEKANLQFAKLNDFGALSCLVDMQERVCLFYTISSQGKYCQVPFEVYDKNIISYRNLKIFNNKQM